MRWQPIGYALFLTLALSACEQGAHQQIELASQGLYTGAISGDGNLAVVGSMNHGGSLWRTTTNERLFSWNHAAGEFTTMTATALSPDTTKAVTADPRTLVVWNTRTGGDLAFWATPAAVLDVAITNDGRGLLMGLEDHSAVLIDPTTGAHTYTFLHQGVVSTVALSADSTVALTGSDDDTAMLWNLRSGALVHRLKHDNPVRVVAVSATGRYLFTAAARQAVTIWDGVTGAPMHVLSERNPGVTSAAFSDDEGMLLLGYVNRNVELWSTQSQRRLGQWRLQSRNALHRNGGAVIAVNFSADRGVYLALTGDGRLAELRGAPG